MAGAEWRMWVTDERGETVCVLKFSGEVSAVSCTKAHAKRGS